MADTLIGLPPGCYERDGKYYRTVLKTGVDEVGEWEADEEREVMLPIATDDASITASRERAAKAHMDFYDPRRRSEGAFQPEVIGWLDRGVKREAEWSWNLGTGAKQNRRYKTVGAAGSSPKRRQPPLQQPEPVAVTGDTEESHHGNG